MKRLSLKWRLVILHTIVMTLVMVFVLTLLFSISSKEISANVKSELQDRVSESFDYISIKNGAIVFDKDFLEIKDGIYLSAYDGDDLDLLYGKIPYGFHYDLGFLKDDIREIKVTDVNYYVLDSDVILADGQKLTIRGIVSIDAAQREYALTLRIALILLPLLFFLTIVSGYILSKRALDPVEKIIKKTDDIRREKDLSKRIGLENTSEEISRLANTFDSLLADVEKGFEREKRFSSDVAHELRTPITVIKMACDDLLKRDGLDQDMKEDLETIKRKNDQMAKMIEKLLLLARAEQGRYKLHKQDFDLSKLATIIGEESKVLGKEQGIEVVTLITPFVRMYGDEDLLERLLSNVLENALKYTRSGGKITLKIDHDKDIKIEVADTGIGMEKSQLEKIFDRFYQVDSSRNDSGSGLGLSFVKWITDVHDGKIDVQSEKDKGTTFTFTFKDRTVKK